MSEYLLHCFIESGNAYKAALMLELSGADWEARPVAYFDGITRTAEWRESLNEMGEAPVLEHHGKRLSQSGVILDYLSQQTGRFGPESEDEKREIWRWILFDNHKFTSYYATLRFMFGIQKSGDTPVTEFLRTRARGAYAVVDKHLETRDFLLGSRPTIADLSLAGYVFYKEETGIDRAAEFPNVEAWAARIAALPGWKAPADLMPPAA
ncbi:Glutathione S-transferase GST-4.5 [Hartmannibacter diazotrophicus]|uniref:Glutathione S-transferase GST-4.5 n=1 Tax=Hartmannibacter diazotrophicus TaxID=1482074 RepID=A0A2C9DE20_9HYPH|nr:glutathione S-transferase [Hartmannibacter diazotrophicus]SON57885.1 Glutathione S-transferase GST-4.5 [Hartmannibacter diazotrophicus]